MAHPKHLITPQFNRRQALMALLGSVALPGCGGGGSVAGLSSGGTGSFTSGVIIGLGSIIVNGIRYDDSAATVNSGAGAPSDLKLGMVVSVQGSSVTPATVAGGLATATATRISYGSEWKGPVDSVNTANSTFVMLGQTVKVLSTTVFDGGTLANLGSNFVEVHGFVDPVSNALSASRVEVKDSLATFRLSGAISQLSTANRTFALGSALISFATATEAPASLSAGIVVSVDLQTTQNSDNQWLATRVRAVNALEGIRVDDEDEAEIEGSITEFTSGSTFSVNGIPVNASNANSPSGLDLDLGLRVKVEGTVINGTIVASKVELESDQAVQEREFEFHDLISELDTIPGTFKVKGYLVTYTNDTTLEPSSTVLANELRVEVKAFIGTNGDLTATQIKLDN